MCQSPVFDSLVMYQVLAKKSHGMTKCLCHSVVCCRQLAQRWNMPTELAHDLATLALYDIVIFADDSGSMIFEEGGERIQDLKLIMGRVAEVATLFDEDGKTTHYAVHFVLAKALMHWFSIWCLA